jgi:nucleotide-binding universal stress UspA family protein
MKIRPTSKTRGVVVELGPEETQIPAQSLVAAPVFKLQKILVPIDFSDCSKKALDYAIPFARQFGAELHLLHVVEPYPAVPEMAPYDAETIEEGCLKMEGLRKQLGNVGPCSTFVRKGAPPTEITSAARELEADLIIISTHGRTGLSRMFVGSTTEKVVRSAPCPVLIVRECEREFVPNQTIPYPPRDLNKPLS